MLAITALVAAQTRTSIDLHVGTCAGCEYADITAARDALRVLRKGIDVQVLHRAAPLVCPRSVGGGLRSTYPPAPLPAPARPQVTPTSMPLSTPRARWSTASSFTRGCTRPSRWTQCSTAATLDSDHDRDRRRRRRNPAHRLGRVATAGGVVVGSERAWVQARYTGDRPDQGRDQPGAARVAAGQRQRAEHVGHALGRLLGSRLRATEAPEGAAFPWRRPLPRRPTAPRPLPERRSGDRALAVLARQ